MKYQGFETKGLPTGVEDNVAVEYSLLSKEVITFIEKKEKLQRIISTLHVLFSTKGLDERTLYQIDDEVQKIVNMKVSIQELDGYIEREGEAARLIVAAGEFFTRIIDDSAPRGLYNALYMKDASRKNTVNITGVSATVIKGTWVSKKFYDLCEDDSENDGISIYDIEKNLPTYFSDLTSYVGGDTSFMKKYSVDQLQYFYLIMSKNICPTRFQNFGKIISDLDGIDNGKAIGGVVDNIIYRNDFGIESLYSSVDADTFLNTLSDLPQETSELVMLYLLIGKDHSRFFVKGESGELINGRKIVDYMSSQGLMSILRREGNKTVTVSILQHFHDLLGIFSNSEVLLDFFKYYAERLPHSFLNELIQSDSYLSSAGLYVDNLITGSGKKQLIEIVSKNLKDLNSVILITGILKSFDCDETFKVEVLRNLLKSLNFSFPVKMDLIDHYLSEMSMDMLLVKKSYTAVLKKAFLDNYFARVSSIMDGVDDKFYLVQGQFKVQPVSRSYFPLTKEYNKLRTFFPNVQSFHLFVEYITIGRQKEIGESMGRLFDVYYLEFDKNIVTAKESICSTMKNLSSEELITTLGLYTTNYKTITDCIVTTLIGRYDNIAGMLDYIKNANINIKTKDFLQGQLLIGLIIKGYTDDVRLMLENSDSMRRVFDRIVHYRKEKNATFNKEMFLGLVIGLKKILLNSDDAVLSQWLVNTYAEVQPFWNTLQVSLYFEGKQLLENGLNSTVESNQEFDDLARKYLFPVELLERKKTDIVIMYGGSDSGGGVERFGPERERFAGKEGKALSGGTKCFGYHELYSSDEIRIGEKDGVRTHLVQHDAFSAMNTGISIVSHIESIYDSYCVAEEEDFRPVLRSLRGHDDDTKHMVTTVSHQGGFPKDCVLFDGGCESINSIPLYRSMNIENQVISYSSNSIGKGETSFAMVTSFIKRYARGGNDSVRSREDIADIILPEDSSSVNVRDAKNELVFPGSMIDILSSYEASQ